MSHEYVKIKNYFVVLNTLMLLATSGLPFCFSTGGLSRRWDQDRSVSDEPGLNQLLASHGLENEIGNYADQMLSMNLWDHGDHESEACHHILDHDIQQAFADECMEKLGISASAA
jgi:hypothetical protein